MQWFDTMARVVVIAALVMIGASLVRSVTDALTVVAHGQSEMGEIAR